MSSWFCSNFCNLQNQKANQIVLVNHKKQITYQFSKIHQANKQINLQNGFIMIKKSLYEQNLANCQKTKKKFIDNDFPPNQKSISQNGLDQLPELKNKNILWKRIPQLYQNCQLIKDKIQPSDIQQGNIGDCYFLSAISALAQNQNNILQIFQKKDSKSMVKNQYGIYKLIINIAGQPQQIIVDDYIPVFAKSFRPVFCKPVNNQFWVVLLQKAWAKINKSYRNIAFGNPHQVLNRFSVAPVFYHNIPANLFLTQIVLSKQTKQFSQNLWNQIYQGHKQNYSMCCGSRLNLIAQGIKSGHSYTLLAAYQFVDKNNPIRLLKLRNPWGNTEYQGKYSQKDPFWDSIDPKIKSKIFDKNQNDGIFLMSYQQFLKSFQSIDIAHCKNSYNYVFKQVRLNGSQNKYYKIIVQRQGQVYITFEKNLMRNSKQNQYENSGISKILISQEYENGKFQYVDCALQTYLADVTVRCKRLKPGAYIAMVSNQQLKQLQHPKSKKATISTYSNSICTIQQIPNIKNYLYQYFITHAIRYNKQKHKIGSFENDWIAKKLIQSSGYGYICINLDCKGTKTFSIFINQHTIMQAGYKLELPQQTINLIKNYNKVEIELQMHPGDIGMFLFKIDFKRQNLSFSFPPRGFNINRII